MRLVIIGGDAAGMSAASRTKRNAPDIEVIVLEQTGDVSYSACGMPYNIADPGRAMDDLIVRKAAVFRDKQGIDLRTGHRVEAIDPAARTLRGMTLDRGPFTLGYDKLLIATGNSPVMPDIPGRDIPGVLALKSLEDGRRIKDYLAAKPVRKALIIGMGYIAMEMAEALRQRGITVAMIKPGPVLLPWLHPELAAVVAGELEANGVVLHLGHRIEAVTQTGERLTLVSSGPRIDTDMVLVAMGVKPNSELARTAGLALGPAGAIAVDRGSRTSNADIYAAGDCADAFHAVTGQRVWIPLALRANRAGWAVADNMTGRPVELPGVAGTAVFKVFDLEVARSGLNGAEAKAAGFDPVETVIQSRSRAHAHPGAATIWVQLLADRASGRLLGAQLVGKEGVAHRINAVAVALHAGMTVAEFSQCDLAYAPPFGPVWDPLLTAANQLVKAKPANPGRG